MARYFFAIEWSDWDTYDIRPVFTNRAAADKAYRELEKIDPSNNRRSVVRVPIFDSFSEYADSDEAPAAFGSKA